jgi:hypothetical protein
MQLLTAAATNKKFTTRKAFDSAADAASRESVHSWFGSLISPWLSPWLSPGIHSYLTETARPLTCGRYPHKKTILQQLLRSLSKSTVDDH